MRHLHKVLPAALILAAIAVPAAAAQTEYKLVKTIDLPGSQGGHGDWTTFDKATDTVWLSQSPDHNVVVIDAATDTVKAVIPGIEDGNGIALSPKYGFLSDNKGNVTVVVDKRTYKKVATLRPEGKGPNGTTYVGKTGNLYVTTDSGDMTVFSAKAPFKEIVHYRLTPDPAKKGPDGALYVASKGLLYQPIDNVIDIIDPVGNKILATWSPGIKTAAKPMVYDHKTRHFLIGTTDLKMLILDANGKAIAAIPVKGNLDETVIDEGARRAFVGDKAGVIEVIDLDHDKLAEVIPSEKNVHTLAVDPKTHTLFVYRNESNKVDVYRRQKVAAN